MAKNSFRSAKKRDIYLHRTMVENLFINEFLPDAPGDHVKVYLFGLMYAQHELDIDTRTIAVTLGLTEKQIIDICKYWEAKGLVKVYPDEDGGHIIEFVRLVEEFYGRQHGSGKQEYEDNGDSEEQSSDDTYAADDADGGLRAAEGDEGVEAILARLIDRQLGEIFARYQTVTGRTISRHEASKLTDAVKIYGIEPDVLTFAIDYCADLEKYSTDYIFKVALRWKEEGCTDVMQVKQILDKHSRRNDQYRQVFTALGFTRFPNPSDREIMDRWFDEMGCSIMEVLDACKATAGIREPNLRYVNKVLENRAAEKGGIDTRAESRSQAGERGKESDVPEAMVSRKVLREYFDHIREEEEQACRDRIDEVCLRIPEMRGLLDSVGDINRQVVSLQPGAEAKEKRQRLRQKRQDLEDSKREMLIRSGYPEDYLDRKYRCTVCKDTGFTDEGRVCACCRQRAEEAYKWNQERGNH